MLRDLTLQRAYWVGFQHYLDGDYINPFSERRYSGTRFEKMDDLAAEFTKGYDNAEREARIELRHARSCRYPGA